MTKVTKIIGSLVVVSALWLGGTAYVSSNTERYLEDYVERSNKIYAQDGVTLSIEKFEKGFFSSKVKTKVDFVAPELKAMLSDVLILPLEIEYEIENGPIFFKNGLGMGASRTHQLIKLSDFLVDKEAFKKMFKEDIIITSNTEVDLLNNIIFTAKTSQIVANIEDTNLSLSPLKLEGDINADTLVGKVNMEVDSIVVENKDEFFKAHKVFIDANIKKLFANGFYLGDFMVKMGKISTKSKDLPFSLEEAKLNMHVNINENEDETVNLDFKFQGDAGASKLPEVYAFLKKVEMNYALEGMKLEGVLAFQDFTKKLQAQQEEIFSRLQSPSTGELDMNVLAELEKMQVETADSMMLLLAGLLEQNRTSLSFGTKVIDKENKQSSINMEMAYVGKMDFPKDAKALEKKFRKELLNLIKLDFKVDLEKAYIHNLPFALQQELNGQLQMGTMFGVVKENNNSFSLDVNYKPKSLNINGTDRLEMLQMLEMGL